MTDSATADASPVSDTSTPAANGTLTAVDTPPAAVPSSPTALPRRAAYRDIPLYDPARRPVEVDLSDNTGLFGPPPSAARALAEMGDDALTRYPEVYADSLKAALAELHGVEPENIVTGCGLDDVIDSAFRAFAEPGETIAYAEPTFGMIPLFAKMNALRPVAVPLDLDPIAGFRLDAERLLAARARITYLCQPNNPTGTLLDRQTIERIATEAAGVILLDEAYADFAGESMTEWAAGSTRTIALRTLSKAWGLAGLRIGYGIGPAELVREIEKSRGPYKITAAADAAARAALANDLEVVRGNVALTRLNRERLRAELEGLGLRVWPSEANFLLVTAPGTAIGFADALRARGVAVRAFPNLPGADECVRISVGPWGMMERLLTAAREVVDGEDTLDDGSLGERDEPNNARPARPEADR